MVRIELRVESGVTVVSIAGRLAADVIQELHDLCKPVEGALVLECSGLISADTQGLQALRELEERGAELRGLSSYLRLLKNGDPAGH
jgi:anti-anti-sigma regulatory factor